MIHILYILLGNHFYRLVRRPCFYQHIATNGVVTVGSLAAPGPGFGILFDRNKTTARGNCNGTSSARPHTTHDIMPATCGVDWPTHLGGGAHINTAVVMKCGDNQTTGRTSPVTTTPAHHHS